MPKCLTSLSLITPTDSVNPPLSDGASPTCTEETDGPTPHTVMESPLQLLLVYPS